MSHRSPLFAFQIVVRTLILAFVAAILAFPVVVSAQDDQLNAQTFVDTLLQPGLSEDEYDDAADEVLNYCVAAILARTVHDCHRHLLEIHDFLRKEEELNPTGFRYKSYKIPDLIGPLLSAVNEVANEDSYGISVTSPDFDSHVEIRLYFSDHFGIRNFEGHKITSDSFFHSGHDQLIEAILGGHRPTITVNGDFRGFMPEAIYLQQGRNIVETYSSRLCTSISYSFVIDVTGSTASISKVDVQFNRSMVSEGDNRLEEWIAQIESADLAVENGVYKLVIPTVDELVDVRGCFSAGNFGKSHFVRLQVDSSPDNAKFEIEDIVAGTTPQVIVLNAKLANNRNFVRIVFRKEGYYTLPLMFPIGNHDSVLSVTLTPLTSTTK